MFTNIPNCQSTFQFPKLFLMAFGNWCFVHQNWMEDHPLYLTVKFKFNLGGRSHQDHLLTNNEETSKVTSRFMGNVVLKPVESLRNLLEGVWATAECRQALLHLSTCVLSAVTGTWCPSLRGGIWGETRRTGRQAAWELPERRGLWRRKQEKDIFKGHTLSPQRRIPRKQMLGRGRDMCGPWASLRL